MTRHRLRGLSILAAAAASALAQAPSADPGSASAGTPPVADPAPQSIRIVHYNLRNYLSMERRVGSEIVERAPKPEREKAPLVKVLATARPDVIGVCEIGSIQDLDDLGSRLDKAGVTLPHRAFVDAADPERHLALLSRFPITADRSQTNLEYRVDEVALQVQRGILDVTLQVTADYRLRFMGAHLKSRREVPEGDQAVMRRHEAYLLRRHIDDALQADPEVNLLICADLNDTRNEPVVRTIQGPFGSGRYLRDLPLADADGERWTYYWNVTDVYERIDFAFVSPGLYPEVDRAGSHVIEFSDWLRASDHRPLVVVIRPRDLPRR